MTLFYQQIAANCHNQKVSLSTEKMPTPSIFNFVQKSHLLEIFRGGKCRIDKIRPNRGIVLFVSTKRFFLRWILIKSQDLSVFGNMFMLFVSCPSASSTGIGSSKSKSTSRLWPGHHARCGSSVNECVSVVLFMLLDSLSLLPGISMNTLQSTPMSRMSSMMTSASSLRRMSWVRDRLDAGSGSSVGSNSGSGTFTEELLRSGSGALVRRIDATFSSSAPFLSFWSCNRAETIPRRRQTWFVNFYSFLHCFWRGRLFGSWKSSPK